MADELKEKESETQETEEKGSETSNKQFEQFEERVTKLLDKFGTEIGEERKARKEFEEQRENLFGALEEIKEKLSTKEEQETDFDPYDRKQLAEVFKPVVEEVVAPLKEGQEGYLTQKQFMELLQKSNQQVQLTDEFKLKGEEYVELEKESVESGKTIRELAFEKYGKRIWGEKAKKQELEQLSDELKKKDVGAPSDTALEAEFEKLGIPADPKKFQALYREKGSQALKELLEEAEKAEGNGAT